MPEATIEQIAAANELISTFDWSDAATTAYFERKRIAELKRLMESPDWSNPCQ